MRGSDVNELKKLIFAQTETEVSNFRKKLKVSNKPCRKYGKQGVKKR